MLAGRSSCGLFAIVVLIATTLRAEESAPDYATQVAPLLTKYCGGCHKADEPEGKFSVATFADLKKGGEHGPVLVPGDAESSRLIQVLNGAADPKMPPEDEAQPGEEELALLRAWITAGAKGPIASPADALRLVVPSLESHTDIRPVTALAASADGKWLAVGTFEALYLLQKGAADDATIAGPSLGEWKPVRRFADFPGKVQAIHFASDSSRLVTASGVAGLGGQAALWNLDGTLIRQMTGHSDLLYDAELSPDGAHLATCSYDRKTMLWNAATGEIEHVLEGHNGAVYDVAFTADSALLATASADDTCKIWSVASGERLDTLSQPLKEVYSVAFSPDGGQVIAAGADNRIRVWQLVSRTEPSINPLLSARFAHEGAILQLAFTHDGKRLVTLADDCTVKVWETAHYTEIQEFERQPAVAAALAVSGTTDEFFIGRMDGTLTSCTIDAATSAPAESAASPPLVASIPIADDPMTSTAEQEPNDDHAEAQNIVAPITLTGAIHSTINGRVDDDYFRFSALKGQEWVIEVNAARSGSPLDSAVEVLDADGRRIERVMLQAVRDTYFTFRGKDSVQSDDFRMFNWEEMDLNEYLYANGEVVKLWRYPRGPDSGFMTYPGEGSRYGYFDTTPLAHALGEPSYIVEPHAPGEALVANGLPMFPIFFENDDDARRELGADSKLTFTAPGDGDYIVRLRDVRGQQGENYTYSLAIRPRRPDFTVTLHGADPTIDAGSSKEFRVTVRRIDDYDGPIEVHIDGLPPGITATTPLVIQPGQLDAFGVLMAEADAPQPTAENAKTSKVVATASIHGQLTTHDVNGFGEIKLGPKPKLLASIAPMAGGAQPVAGDSGGLLEFVIEPGTTIMLSVHVERDGYDGQAPFGGAESGRNLPHGLYVDNIGLNGLLILEGQAEREFFVTAARWAPEQSRLFHLKTDVEGGQATRPVLLHVRRKDATAAR